MANINIVKSVVKDLKRQIFDKEWRDYEEEHPNVPLEDMKKYKMLCEKTFEKEFEEWFNGIRFNMTDQEIEMHRKKTIELQSWRT